MIMAYFSRSDNKTLAKLGVFSNQPMNLWLLAVIIFLFLALAVPKINTDLKLAPISLAQFALIFVLSLLILSWLEIRKLFLAKVD